MKTLKEILLYVWQLPQNLLGLIILFYVKDEKKTSYKDVNVYRSCKMQGGISLGKYIIVNQFANDFVVRHEYGHTRQSIYLGWLYLIVIGIPSLLWAVIHNEAMGDYYSFYTEKWANKLAGL